MAPRDTHEGHRASSPLELFFDLCFVVAVAFAGTRLHHSIVEHHLASGIQSYLMVFFAIWWAWMGFTWLSSAYDNDDVFYRLMTFVQIAGALVIAAGVPSAFDDRDFTVVTLGYTLMRVGLVTLWWRAVASDGENPEAPRRYAVGLMAVQTGWLLLLLAPSWFKIPGFLILVACELTVPMWSARAGHIPWHPGHIADRYAAFTLIVLGESVLSATVAVSGAIEDPAHRGSLLGTVVGGLLILFGMWWKYFARNAEHFLHHSRQAFEWGYGAYALFASAAAVGAGLAAVVEVLAEDEGLTPAVAAAVTVPTAIFVAVVWFLQIRITQAEPLATGLVVGVGALLILAATFTAQPVLLAGLLLVAMIVVATVIDDRTPPRTVTSASA